MELKKILIGLDGLKVKGDLSIDIKKIESDSSKVNEDTLFVAIKGFESDGHDYILEAIEKEFHGDSKKAFKTIVYATLSPSEYFATRVHDAVKGLGTKDHLLIRVIVSRSEIDLPQIKQYYKQLFGKDMYEDVKNDISGDYRTLLLGIIG